MRNHVPADPRRMGISRRRKLESKRVSATRELPAVYHPAIPSAKGAEVPLMHSGWKSTGRKRIS
jgi:hypothetical protein